MAEDIEFPEILAVLEQIHEEFPDMRFGRVLQEAMDRDLRKPNTNLFDISSKKLLSSLNKYLLDEQQKRGRD